MNSVEVEYGRADPSEWSRAEILASLGPEERKAFFADLQQEALLELEHDWNFWGRPKQQEPDRPYSCWMILAGRGWGKTQTGVHWIEKKIRQRKKSKRKPLRMALVAETAADARDVLVEGDSGILNTIHPSLRPVYKPSKRTLVFPDGDQAWTFSGDEPGQLRGPQFDVAWVDELAKYKYPDETIDNLEFGLRLGINPQYLVTTTPRPIKIIRQILADPDTVVTRGSTYENIGNLAPKFIKRVVKKYEGTRLGRQELHAHVLDDVPNSLWTRDLLDQTRVHKVPALRRIIVAVDPTVSENADVETSESDECGIMVGGVDERDHGYLIEDLSDILSPEEWARRTVDAFHEYKADSVVGEVNNGGDLVRINIHVVDKSVPFRKVTASRAKHVRAEPISTAHEQKRIHLVGNFAKLEDQLCMYTSKGYVGGDSPDRGDAFVWLFSALLLSHSSVDNDSDNWKQAKINGGKRSRRRSRMA